MRLAVACALLSLLLALGACGSGTEEDPAIPGTRLRIYTSLPLEGAMAGVARDTLRAQKLALRDHGGRVGRYAIELVPLDAASEERHGWDPRRVSENARAAADDRRAVAYLGELQVGASAISIPLLNQAGILSVSPLDTAQAFTSPNAAVPGSPGKYYPRADEVGQTFARVVPSDRAEALAQVRYMALEGVRRLLLLSDEGPLGGGSMPVMARLARRQGIAVVGREDVDPGERDPRELVARILERKPDAVFYAGAVDDGIVRLWRRLAAVAPTLKLFVPGSVADARFVRAIGAAADATYVTRPVLPLDAYPPAARRFARRFARAYGAPPAPEALYGYEAMNAVLAAIRTAVRETRPDPLDRAAVVRAFFATRRRGTVLGSYEIRATGDTSLRRFGAYRIVDGTLRFVRALDA